MFFINQPLFQQKTTPLYPNPKYLFEFEPQKNYGFSHRVSVVRGCSEAFIHEKTMLRVISQTILSPLIACNRFPFSRDMHLLDFTI